VGRLLRPALLGASALMLAGAMTLTAAVALGGSSGSTGSTGPTGSGSLGTHDAAGQTTRPGSTSWTGSTGLTGSTGSSGSSVAALQQRLRDVPRDHRGWATLALAYVEQARVTADPTFYARADGALGRAARLAPGDSVVLTADATLATARHQFSRALSAAGRAIDANPYSAQAWAVRSDALTELGRYGEARTAARRADDLEPGPPTFARLSYQAELRGDLAEATRLMRLSRDAATADAPAYAFASFHLGELARAAGDLPAAGRHYAAALSADPTHAPALAGRARLATARGDVTTAVRTYRSVVARLPLPEYVAELADLYLATGRPERADQQLAVAAASARLAAANGVRTDLEIALIEADHGSPADALRAARAEWSVRRTIHTADAMAWALHAAGRDREALSYARPATALGTQDARLLFHRGAVEAALGLRGPARAHLRAALRLDAGVAPLRKQQAEKLLEELS
jgi:tetratricopeptide (TPR) repeat protein